MRVGTQTKAEGEKTRLHYAQMIKMKKFFIKCRSQRWNGNICFFVFKNMAREERLDFSCGGKVMRFCEKQCGRPPN